MTIPPRPFGDTGLSVSALGYGAGQIGAADLSESQAEMMLNRVLDEGITLIDTARGYGLSEVRIGRYISHRRDEFVLSTKVGYDVEGVDNWSYAAVDQGINQALQTMKTEVLDIVHLHSCPQEILEQGEVIRALEDAQQKGKIRVAAYSGENEALAYALDSGRFGSCQTSVNIFDQRGIGWAIPQAQAAGIGVIAKRPIGNAPWRFKERPVGHYCEPYWERWQAMQIDPPLSWNELALRFSAFTPGVHSCIVGTTSLNHLLENIAHISQGALPAADYQMLQEAFQRHDSDWVGLI